MSQFIGTTGADTVTGTAEYDYIEGRGGADRLAAGGGDDTIVSGYGAVSLDGGSGVDLARLDFSQATSSLNYVVGTASQTVAGVKIMNFEQAYFTGGQAGDRITGGALDDILRGEGGSDWLKGEGGNDQLKGGDGLDILEGGAGNDTLDGGAGFDQLTGGDGDDQIYVAAGDVAADGGAGRDIGILDFSASTAGLNFSVAANQAAAVKLGGTAVKGFDIVYFTGGSGGDTLGGGDDGDLLSGRGGDDVLTGGRGEDVVDGGDGFDIARYSGQASDYRAVLLDNGAIRITDLRTGGDGIDTVRGIESFSFSDGVLTRDQLLNGAANHAPSAMADAFTVSEDGTTELRLLDNDSDPDAGDVLTISGVDTAGLQGVVGINGDGSISYTAGSDLQHLAAGQTSVQHFSYTVADDHGATATSEVTVTVVGVNDGPTAQDDYVLLTEDETKTIDVLGNDYDVDDGDSVSLVSVGAGARGAAQIVDGQVVYTPTFNAQFLAEGDTAVDEVAYTVRDEAGLTSTGVLRVVIQGQNDGPDAQDDAVAIGKTGVARLNYLLANDSDLDHGDTIAIKSVSGTSASGATVTLGANGEVAYDPSELFAHLQAGQTATDSFTYVLTDSHGAESTATVELTISGSATPEQDLMAMQFVTEDQSTDDFYDYLAANAEFVFGGPVTIESVDTTGTLGSVQFGDGHLVYTADDDRFDGLWGDGHDETSFLYTVRTQDGELHTGAVNVTVYGSNDDPLAQADEAAAVAGGSTGELWTHLLSNDIDPDRGQQHAIIGVDTTGTAGQVLFDRDSHSVSYRAEGAVFDGLAPGETLTDHFVYTMEDEYGVTSQAVVTITVTGGEGWAFAA